MWEIRDEPGEPRTEIHRIGRWCWSVRIAHGILHWGPNGGFFIVWGGRARVERVAARLLARYRREQEHLASRERIRV